MYFYLLCCFDSKRTTGMVLLSLRPSGHVWLALHTWGIDWWGDDMMMEWGAGRRPLCFVGAAPASAGRRSGEQWDGDGDGRQSGCEGGRCAYAGTFA